MDNQKITFIVCSDSELCYEECLGYIDRLRIPDGYEIDVICIIYDVEGRLYTIDWVFFLIF